uniref:Uncharacterized protein n=1 Tax=Aegilops tauschii subsp. strangulata TaxID=200361 RepID=A0A453F4X5_AEGTS
SPPLLPWLPSGSSPPLLRGKAVLEEVLPLTPASKKGKVRARALGTVARVLARGRTHSAAAAVEAGSSARGKTLARPRAAHRSWSRGARWSARSLAPGGSPYGGGGARVPRRAASPALQQTLSPGLLRKGDGGRRALGPVAAGRRVLQRPLLGGGGVLPRRLHVLGAGVETVRPLRRPEARAGPAIQVRRSGHPLREVLQGLWRPHGVLRGERERKPLAEVGATPTPPAEAETMRAP